MERSRGEYYSINSQTDFRELQICSGSEVSELQEHQGGSVEMQALFVLLPEEIGQVQHARIERRPSSKSGRGTNLRPFLFIENWFI